MRALRVLAWVWVLVLLGAGLGGGLIMSRVGWALAGGLSIYTGNTEPVRADLPFPWAIYAVCVAVAVVGVAWILRERRGRRAEEPAPEMGSAAWLRALAPMALAYLGGLVAALLPFLQLFRLFAAVQAAAGGPVMP